MIAFAVANEANRTAWLWFLLVTAGVAVLGFALAYGRAISPRKHDQRSRSEERDTVLDVPERTPEEDDR